MKKLFCFLGFHSMVFYELWHGAYRPHFKCKNCSKTVFALILIIYSTGGCRNRENDGNYSAQYWKYMPENLSKPYIHKYRVFRIGEVNYVDGSGVSISNWGFDGGLVDSFLSKGKGYRYVFDFDGTFGGYTLSELKEISEEVQYSKTGTAIDIGYSQTSFKIESWYDTIKPKKQPIDSSKYFYRRFIFFNKKVNEAIINKNDLLAYRYLDSCAKYYGLLYPERKNIYKYLPPCKTQSLNTR